MTYAKSSSTETTVNSQNSSSIGAQKQTNIDKGQENAEISNSNTKMKDTPTDQEKSSTQNNNTTGMYILSYRIII